MATESTPSSPTEDPEQAGPGAGGRSPFPPAGKFLAGRRDNIDLLKALFLALVVTALFYEVFPLPFIDQELILTLFEPAVSEVITGMAFWSCFLLFFKFLNYRVQIRTQQAFAEPEVLAVLGQGVYARNADAVLEQLTAALREFKTRKFETSIIYRRVSQVLHFVRSAPKKEMVSDLLSFQSQIDVKKTEAGFTLLHVFIWAIPILGFIGTVWPK